MARVNLVVKPVILMFMIAALISLPCRGEDEEVIDEDEDAYEVNGSVTIDATDYCLSHVDQHTSKDLFPDPAGDCHIFYHCVFVNETYAIGERLQCSSDTYFSEQYQTCLYEGPIPCIDECRDEAVHKVGCASVPGSCSLFIRCGRGSSEMMCCPERTRFNPDTCQCDGDTTCTDYPCSVPSLITPTSLPAPTYNATYCTDSFGNVLTSVLGQPSHFLQINPKTGSKKQTPCTVGSVFSLEQCSCGNLMLSAEGTYCFVVGTSIRAYAVERAPGSYIIEESDAQTKYDCPRGSLFSLTMCQCFLEPAECSLYLPFDSNINDYSSSQFTTFLYGNADIDTKVAARGEGSFSTGNGGRLEIPMTTALDFQHDATFCLFYRCPGRVCSTGGLLSNNINKNSTAYTAILASLAPNRLQTLFMLQYPVGLEQISGTTPSTNNGFNQICAVFDGEYTGAGVLSLYINNVLLTEKSFESGWLYAANSPFTVGSDPAHGDFAGHIDEVLICPKALSSAEISAHWHGREALTKLNLIPNIPY